MTRECKMQNAECRMRNEESGSAESAFGGKSWDSPWFPKRKPGQSRIFLASCGGHMADGTERTAYGVGRKASAGRRS
jgi:hypothetical protein